MWHPLQVQVVRDDFQPRMLLIDIFIQIIHSFNQSLIHSTIHVFYIFLVAGNIYMYVCEVLVVVLVVRDDFLPRMLLIYLFIQIIHSFNQSLIHSAIHVFYMFLVAGNIYMYVCEVLVVVLVVRDDFLPRMLLIYLFIQIIHSFNQSLIHSAIHVFYMFLVAGNIYMYVCEVLVVVLVVRDDFLPRMLLIYLFIQIIHSFNQSLIHSAIHVFYMFLVAGNIYMYVCEVLVVVLVVRDDFLPRMLLIYLFIQIIHSFNQSLIHSAIHVFYMFLVAGNIYMYVCEVLVVVLVVRDDFLPRMLLIYLFIQIIHSFNQSLIHSIIHVFYIFLVAENIYVCLRGVGCGVSR